MPSCDNQATSPYRCRAKIKFNLLPPAIPAAFHRRDVRLLVGKNPRVSFPKLASVNYDTGQAIFARYPRTIRARLLAGDFLTVDFGGRIFGKFGASSW